MLATLGIMTLMAVNRYFFSDFTKAAEGPSVLRTGLAHGSCRPLSNRRAEPGPEPFVCHSDLNHCDLEPRPRALELGFAKGVSWPCAPPPTLDIRLCLYGI